MNTATAKLEVIENKESAGELIAIGSLNALTVFSDGSLDPIIDKIEKEVKAEVLDISTAEGRKRIASLAYKVAKTKTALDDMGKKLVSGWKEQAKKVDIERSRAWDKLEALQKEVRSPLTEWENREKDRIADHEGELALLEQCAKYAELNTLPSDQARGLIVKAKEVYGRDWQEFAQRAADLKKDVIARLEKNLEDRIKHEAEQAELARLRQEESDRKQREHEERLKAEAAAKAKAETETAAKAEADALAAKVKAEREAAARREETAHREKAEAEERARKAEDARIAAEAKAKVDREAAAEKARLDAIAAEEKAKRDAEAAAQRERQKIEAEKKAEADALAKREADKQHKAKINGEAMKAVLAAITANHIANKDEAEKVAKTVIQAIAKGEIPHVRISY